jgi:hypothetical protein
MYPGISTTNLTIRSAKSYRYLLYPNLTYFILIIIEFAVLWIIIIFFAEYVGHYVIFCIYTNE